MSRAAEFLAFLGLAAGLHLAALLGVEGAGTSGAGPAGPAATAVIGGASPAVAALVEAWETPPETGTREGINTAEPIVEASPPEPRTAPETVAAIAGPATELAAPPAPPLPAAAPVPDHAPEPAPGPERPPEKLSAAPPTAIVPAAKPAAPPRRADPAPNPAPDFAPAPGPADARGVAAARAGLTEAEIVSLRVSYGALVRAAIERHKSYPRRARLRRIEGVARLQVTIDRQGGLVAASIASSSGAASLDQAALRAAQAVGRYPPPPPELGGDRFSFVVAMAFRLQ